MILSVKLVKYLTNLRTKFLPLLTNNNDTMTPNGELAHQLNLQLLKTRMAFRKTIQKVLKKNHIEMTFEMLQIIYQLSINQGVSQQHLAETTARDKACLTNLINNIEKKGWVVRQNDLNDRRNQLIFLTEEGAIISDRVKLLLKDIYDSLGERINPKLIENCTNGLKQMKEALDEI